MTSPGDRLRTELLKVESRAVPSTERGFGGYQPESAVGVLCNFLALTGLEPVFRAWMESDAIISDAKWRRVASALEPGRARAIEILKKAR